MLLHRNIISKRAYLNACTSLSTITDHTVHDQWVVLNFQQGKGLKRDFSIWKFVRQLPVEMHKINPVHCWIFY